MEFHVGKKKVATSRQKSPSVALSEKVKLLTHLTLPPLQVTFNLLDCAGWVNESFAYFMLRLKPPPSVETTFS